MLCTYINYPNSLHLKLYGIIGAKEFAVVTQIHCGKISNQSTLLNLQILTYYGSCLSVFNRG